MAVIIACGMLAMGKLTVSGISMGKIELFKSSVKRVQTFLSRLYTDDINPYDASVRYRDEQKINGDEFTYGEIVVPTFAEMLYKTTPKPGEVFYDLGCGAGKAVFTAALCFPFLRVKGVELLPPLYEMSNTLNERFKHLVVEDPFFKKNTFDIEIILGNLLQIDISKGNIFFLNATCFREEDWNNLLEKLLNLPVGVRFIIVTRQLYGEAFELIESGTYPMSWGASSVFVYRKIR